MTPVSGPHLTPDDFDAWLAGALAPGSRTSRRVAWLPGARGDRARDRRAPRHAAAHESRAGFAERVMARVAIPSRVASGARLAPEPGLRHPPLDGAGRSLLVLVAGSMAGQRGLDAGPSGHLAALGGWLTAQAGQVAWLGVRGVASNFMEQPWFAGFKACAAHPAVSASPPRSRSPPTSAGSWRSAASWPCPRSRWPMRAVSRLLRAVALLSVLAPRAASPVHAQRSRRLPTEQLVHGFWSLVADVATRPAERRPDAPSRAAGDSSRRKGERHVALDDLSQPTRIESAAQREALRPMTTASALTVTNGTARMGDFSIGLQRDRPRPPAGGPGHRRHLRQAAR